VKEAQVDVTAIALSDQTWLGSTFLILSSNTAFHRMCRSLHERQMHLLPLTDFVLGSSESAAARKVSPGKGHSESVSGSDVLRQASQA